MPMAARRLAGGTMNIMQALRKLARYFIKETAATVTAGAAIRGGIKPDL